MDLIADISMCNLWGKLHKSPSIVSSKQMNIWRQFIITNYDSKIRQINGYDTRFPRIIDDGIVRGFFKQRLNILYELLVFAKGKISLCGISVFYIILMASGNKQLNLTDIGDLELFFHCTSTEEADNLLSNCVNFVSKNCSCTYIISQKKLTIDSYPKSINFILKFYINKRQIFLDFALPSFRFGWNPFDDVFSTICGAFAFAMVGFSIVLPGIDEMTELINNSDCDLAIDQPFHRHGFYYQTDKKLPNWEHINAHQYDKISFSLSKIDDLSEFTQCMLENNVLKNGDIGDPYSKGCQKFIGSKYKDFIIAVNNYNTEQANDILDERTKYYAIILKEIADKIKLNRWNQHTTKHIKRITPKQWYDKSYKPFEIGITTIRFQALMDCRKNIYYLNILPQEIFKIICEYWFEAEANDAKNRLFKLI